MGAVELTKMRRRVGQKVRRMTTADALAWLERYMSEGTTGINHETVRELTGGHCSQSISGYVKRKVWDKARGR